MANVRFKTETFAEVGVIRDRAAVRAWPYGLGPYVMGSFAGTHRQHYSTLDAQHVCDWLNERERFAVDAVLAEQRERHDR